MTALDRVSVKPFFCLSMFLLFSLGVPLGDHSRAVTALAFSMDGVSLVSGSEDGTARLWDTVSRQVVRTYTHSKGKQICF